MDALRDHLRNDLRHDRDDHRVRCNVNRRDHRVMDDRHVNRKCDLWDDDHRLPLDDRHRMDFRGVDDLKLGVNLDVSRDHRMNAQLGDHLMDDDHRDVLGDLRKNVMDDRNDLMMVVNLLNRNCALHDQNLDAKMDGNLYPRMNVMDDLNLDASRANRNCALHDQMKDVNLDAMSHRVKLTGDRSTSCDRMSRDHLRCDHLMMRHHDTNRMDVRNLDVKMKIHHVNHPKMDVRMHLNRESHLMMVCRKMI